MAPNGSTEGAAARVSKPGACSVFWSSAFCAAAFPALAVVLDLSFAPMTATDAKPEGPDVLTVWAVSAALLWAAALASGAWSSMLGPSCMRGASGLLVLSTAASTVSGVALGMESGLAGLTGCEGSALRSCHSCSEAGLPTLILKPPGCSEGALVLTSGALGEAAGEGCGIPAAGDVAGNARWLRGGVLVGG